MQTQSYCLKAGTHGPGEATATFRSAQGTGRRRGDDYRSQLGHRPEIEQSRIQSLLWAIIARAKFEDLAPELKATASQLLTPRQLSSLNRSALDVLRECSTDALGGVPER